MRTGLTTSLSIRGWASSAISACRQVPSVTSSSVCLRFSSRVYFPSHVSSTHLRAYFHPQFRNDGSWGVQQHRSTSAPSSPTAGILTTVPSQNTFNLRRTTLIASLNPSQLPTFAHLACGINSTYQSLIGRGYGEVSSRDASSVASGDTQQGKQSPRRRPISASVDISSILNRQRDPRGFKVIEFFPTAVAKDFHHVVSPQYLGIHPRDLSLFHTDNRLARQRATITARDNAIFIKTEAVRAIVSADKAVVFKSRSERENQNIIAPMLQAISSHDEMPFEMCAVEVLLYATVVYFERRISHLSWMLDTVLNDLQSQSMQEPFATVSSETMIQQLVPLDKALTAARNDAKETCEALQELLDDDRLLSAICLSEQRHAMTSIMHPECGDGWSGPGNIMQQQQQQQQQQEQQRRQGFDGDAARKSTSSAAASHMAVHRVPLFAMLQATRMLQSYHREMSSVEAVLVEMEENLDTTRESWRMKLDSARNHLMLLNLWLSMISISLTLSMVLPSAFGMNISHGMEDITWVFYAVTGFSLLAGLISYPLAFRFYKRQWTRTSELEFNKVNRLRIILMQHLDDLDDILEECDHIPDNADAKQFALHLRRRLPHLHLNNDTVDFLFQQFDMDNNGKITVDERSKQHAKTLQGLRWSRDSIKSRLR